MRVKPVTNPPNDIVSVNVCRAGVAGENVLDARTINGSPFDTGTPSAWSLLITH
jgi:hypothetical protein